MPEFMIPASFTVEASTRASALEAVQSLIDHGLETGTNSVDASILAGGADTPEIQQLIGRGRVSVGDRFLNCFPELDGADSSEIGVNRFVGRDGERWTPARSVWVVRSLDGDGFDGTVAGIHCEETGGYINPNLTELLDPTQFTRLP